MEEMTGDKVQKLLQAVREMRKLCFILPGRTEITVPAQEFNDVEHAADMLEASLTNDTDGHNFSLIISKFCKKWADYEPTRQEAVALMTAWEKVAKRFERK